MKANSNFDVDESSMDIEGLDLEQYALTGGTIAKVMRNEEIPEGPLIQILGVRKYSHPWNVTSYRLCISDGLHTCGLVMVAKELNQMFDEDTITRNAIVKVNQMTCNETNNRKVIILSKLELVAPGSVNSTIGDPKPWKETEEQLLGDNNQPSANIPEIPKTSIARASRASTTSSAIEVKTKALSTAIRTDQFVPIRDINPFVNNVTICARVTKKEPIKLWSNARGEGKLFSMDLLDSSGEIKMTGFNQSVDEHYNSIEPSKTYTIRKFTVKSANKQYSNLAHNYEIGFLPDTVFLPYLKDASHIPAFLFSLTPIEQIQSVKPNSIVDVIGICKSFQKDTQSIVIRKTGKEVLKRDVNLLDQTLKEIKLTLWGKDAHDFVGDSYPVVFAKGVKVSDFGGASLNFLQSSVLQINPDFVEATKLRQWFDNDGINMSTQNISNGKGGPTAPWKCISEGTTTSQTEAGKADYFRSHVTLLNIKQSNITYKACSSPDCFKKVEEYENEEFHCNKCKKTSKEFTWRLLLQAEFCDFSGNFWATAFNESAELILGKTSQEMGQLQNQDENKFHQVLKNARLQQFMGKFRTKMEAYQNQLNQKIDVLELVKINHGEYAKQLLLDIKENKA